MISLLLSLMMFVVQYAFGWLICVWCGTWLPLTGQHLPGCCRHCGRVW